MYRSLSNSYSQFRSQEKGKWVGGVPVPGYEGRKLLVNEEEASQVRIIYKLYLEYPALIPVVEELSRRDWIASGG